MNTRHVVVVGGGVADTEAARVTAEAGHRVSSRTPIRAKAGRSP